MSTGAARMPPPTRGRPYYDVASGRRMIVPASGGGAIPYVGERAEWSPGRALRRAGIRATSRADSSARAAPGAAARALKRSDVLPNLGGGQLGLGGLLVYAFASIVALALLENALTGRGPGAVSKVLAFAGGAISRLVSPNDPLVPKGQPPSNAASGSGAGAPDAIPGQLPAKPSRPAAIGAAVYKRDPLRVAGVSFTGVSLVGTKVGLVQRIAEAAKLAGATTVQVISGRRTPASNLAAGGVQDSNHLTGDAIDATAYIPGRGWVPLGSLTSIGIVGLRSGDTAGFFNGHPDRNHVDTGANQ